MSDSAGQRAMNLRSKAESKPQASKVWSLISNLDAMDRGAGGLSQTTPSSVDLEPSAFRAIVGLIERAQQELMRR